MKNLETVGRVTHTHTHTQAFLNNVIASNCKTFDVSKNKKDLNYTVISTVIF